MAPSRPVVAALIGCALLAPASRAATVRVLFRSGDAAADGTRLDSLDNPIATGPSTVAFRGGTSAVLLREGAQFVVVARTGDPLPPPLVGTFNALGDPAINDHGVVAFAADLNAAEEREQIFLYEAGSLVSIAPASGGRIVPDINDSGDVLIRRNRRLQIWSRATGEVADPVGRGNADLGVRRYTRFGLRPVLSDAGVIAYQAEFRTVRTRGQRSRRLSGIFTISGTAAGSIAREGEPSPIPNATYDRFPARSQPFEALSINAGGDVAFTAVVALPNGQTRAVFLHRADGTGTVVIAQAGDLVDGVALADISPAYAGVDAAGRVAFVGCLAGGACRLVLAANGTLVGLTGDITFTEFAPRLTDASHVAWQRGDDLFRYDGTITPILGVSDATPLGNHVVAGRPRINEAGTVAFRARRNALYLLADGSARPLVAGGDPVAGGTTIRSIGAHAYRGDVAAFGARESEGRSIIALDRGADVTKLVASGDPTPIGGSFALLDDPLALQSNAVVFMSAVREGSAPTGLFRADFDGHVEALVTSGTAAPGGRRFHSVDGLIAAEGGTAVFAATLDDFGSGLFALRGRRTTEVANIGDRLPGRRKREIEDFGPVATNGSRVIFATFTGEGGMLLLKRNKTTAHRLARDGARAPGGGRFTGVFDAVALGSSRVAFVGGLLRRPWPEGLFVGREGRIRLLVATGAETGDGAILQLGGAESMTLVGGTVVLRAMLTGGVANQGLVSISGAE